MQLLDLSFLYVFGSVLISLAGMAVVRKIAPHEVMEGHREVAGFIYGVLGTIYAVILGFSVIVLWDQFHEAEVIADREASYLGSLYRLAQWWPADQMQAFTRSVQKYCRLVIDDEWPLMDQGKYSPKTREQFLEIWRECRSLEPRTEVEKIIFGKMLDTMANLDDARRGRILAARDKLPKPIWFVLISGAVITIGFSYLFGLKNVVAHAVMTMLLATSIGLGLFLIAGLEGPFSGSLSISPEAFKALMETFDRTADITRRAENVALPISRGNP
jgi:Protein of unknown function (DUF4239)